MLWASPTAGRPQSDPAGRSRWPTRWATFFYHGAGPDVRVFGPEGDRTPYMIFARADLNGRWVRVDTNRHGIPNGVAAHDFGHHGLERASQLLIRNDGPVNLYIDAATPTHREPSPPCHDEDHARRHQ